MQTLNISLEMVYVWGLFENGWY